MRGSVRQLCIQRLMTAGALLVVPRPLLAAQARAHNKPEPQKNLPLVWPLPLGRLPIKHIGSIYGTATVSHGVPNRKTANNGTGVDFDLNNVAPKSNAQGALSRGSTPTAGPTPFQGSGNLRCHDLEPPGSSY